MKIYMCWANDGSQTAEDAFPYEAHDASEAAERCAEREYSESAGENPSPMDVHVTSPSGKHTVWSVTTEYVTAFYAKMLHTEGEER